VNSIGDRLPGVTADMLGDNGGGAGGLRPCCISSCMNLCVVAVWCRVVCFVMAYGERSQQSVEVLRFVC
jgi:hypothetical protein